MQWSVEFVLLCVIEVWHAVVACSQHWFLLLSFSVDGSHNCYLLSIWKLWCRVIRLPICSAKLLILRLRSLRNRSVKSYDLSWLNVCNHSHVAWENGRWAKITSELHLELLMLDIFWIFMKGRLLFHWRTWTVGICGTKNITSSL